MPDTTVVVSIGRNIGDAPMNDEMWEDFRDRVFRQVEKGCSAIHFFGDGVGVYEGVEEESYTVIGTVKDEYDHSMFIDLCDTADDFWQESIAITFGTTGFARASFSKFRQYADAVARD